MDKTMVVQGRVVAEEEEVDGCKGAALALVREMETIYENAFDNGENRVVFPPSVEKQVII